MKEWTDEFNPFNTWKVLFHIDKLIAISKGEFPPPITCDTDLSNACNQNCIYCNSSEFRKETGPTILPKDHVLKIANVYKDWGVLSTCIGGGGEPTINPALKDFIERVTKNDIESGVITNGVIMKDDLKKVIVESCRFLGISFDAGDKDTYIKMRGKDDLNKVLKNMKDVAKLKAKLNSKIDFTAKILIHPFNYNKLFIAAKRAKEVGCNAVQIRPVAVDNIRGSKSDKRFHMKEYLSIIEDQVEQIYDELEDNIFKVFAVTHKFSRDLGRAIRFKKCRATPIQAVFGADGWVYNCFNIRGLSESRICRHVPDPYEILKVWGTEQHKKVLEQIDPVNKCIRCTYNRYNAIIEKAILEDNMFHKFP